MVKDIWASKHRPSAITEYIFQDESHKAIILNFIATKSIPHLLLSGHRGTGKTTLARILKNELGIEDVDFLTLNASDDNSVETIRTKIKMFITTFALGPFKIVFLDEADFLTLNAQAVLRNMLEDENYTANARFILSCNHPKKIIPELRSRCQEFSFKTLDKDAMMERLATVLMSEKVKVPDIELLDKYIDIAHPDFRKVLILAEQNTINGVLQEPVNLDTSMEYKIKVLEHLEQNDWESIRTVVCANVDGDEWLDVYRFLYEYLNEVGKFKDIKKWKSGIVIIADHLFRHSSVADSEINFTACMIRLTEV